jgi:hypothetical protein
MSDQCALARRERMKMSVHGWRRRPWRGEVRGGRFGRRRLYLAP